MNKRLVAALIPLAVWAVLLLMPVPQGLAPQAWWYFALFAAVIVALITEPIPGSVVGLLGVSMASVLQLISTKPAASLSWALSGFSNSVIWLIFVAYIFGLGYEKSGLGKRIALTLVKRLGRKTLGLGYAVALSDLVLAPFMPSNTARSGGTIFPIAKNIPAIFDSHPGESARKIGAYLMWTGLAACAVTSTLFLTANAPNLLGVELVAKTLKLDITWRDWFLGIAPLAIVLFLLVPVLSYWLYPPEIKTTEGASAWADGALARMGGMTRKEWMMAGLALAALLLWIFADKFINATMVAIVVFVVMLLVRIISWDDVLEYRQAWNMLIWFGTLVALADGLGKVGFLKWFAAATAGLLQGLPILWIVVALVAVYFLVHYMFASLTAHATALMPVFLAAVLAVPEMPLMLVAMLLCYTSGFSCLLTPYASGPSVIYFGSDYIKRADFWRLGAIFGLIFLAALLALGLPYLKWYLGA
ncbi:MAG: DASS family sodium-coupled anion symporter [Rubrivivax sp.]|nr:DASS family sodium-coupled anion symporter [Rubrivivax sp.]